MQRPVLLNDAGRVDLDDAVAGEKLRVELEGLSVEVGTDIGVGGYEKRLVGKDDVRIGSPLSITVARHGKSMDLHGAGAGLSLRDLQCRFVEATCVVRVVLRVQ